MFHIPGPGAETQIKPARLLNVDDAVMARRNRHFGFLMVAGYFLIVGISYFFARAIAGAFQWIVLVPALLVGGGFLLIGWYFTG